MPARRKKFDTCIWNMHGVGSEAKLISLGLTFYIKNASVNNSEMNKYYLR